MIVIHLLYFMLNVLLYIIQNEHQHFVSDINVFAFQFNCVSEIYMYVLCFSVQ